MPSARVHVRMLKLQPCARAQTPMLSIAHKNRFKKDTALQRMVRPPLAPRPSPRAPRPSPFALAIECGGGGRLHIHLAGQY